MSFIETIAEAVNSAQRAVSLDSATGDYAKAAAFYKSCVEAIRDALPQLPDEASKATLSSKLSLYESRLATLNEFLGVSKKGANKAALAPNGEVPPIIFQEDMSLPTRFMALPPPPPDDMELTTFWLGTILLGTVRRGGFVTTALWVPKEVWIQPGEAVPHYLEKLSFLIFCSDMFTKISKINVHNLKPLLADLESIGLDVWAVWSELAELVPGLQPPQMNLANSRDKKIYAQRKNLAAESFKAHMQANNTSSTEAYSKALVEVISKSASLEKVLGLTQDSKEAERCVELAKRANSFLNVLVVSACQDLASLITCYFERAKAA
eukprot:CAMPEP_0114628096 /NCGR_PEP_ID=MMETSP0168-20121206/12639_1 /TAXON_ID=95228 ORGANISM="Vannella sp., Strain DIVA3 517/6/12" /NCGR_SAMPLE_ID=MMETSP0168 /ASSEMBLY_ACC=CAM_ASM_000044 /LENGTH=322 /DNA_ID=CAMNT_0001839457 /DNA_START=82 /DNA_END=1046 /DNA_ORIENTATION=+